MLEKNRYLITNWYGIPPKFILNEDGSLAEDRLLEMFEAGLNLITISYTPEINKKVLEFCHKHNVRCTVEDRRMYKAMQLGDDWEKIIEDIVNDYKDYPALFNYHVMDEPSSGHFPMLKKISDKLLELDPEHEPYINLLPNYALPAQLGNATYAEHVEEFIKQVNPPLLSYDHYHFCKGEKKKDIEIKDERERLIYESAFTSIDRAGFFDNFEVVRELSLKYNVPYMIIILLVEHGSYRYLTEAEIRWEVFQSLAYGSNVLSYFTYWTPFGENDDIWHWKDAMISVDGKKCQHYFDVKKINPELQKVGNELLGSKSEAVFHIGKCSEKVKFFTEYAGIEEIKMESGTIGFFDNGMAVIANKDFKNSSEVTFLTDKKLELFDKINGKWKCFESKKITLAPGDGELIRIIK